jgi:hypothetical protein
VGSQEMGFGAGAEACALASVVGLGKVCGRRQMGLWHAISHWPRALSSAILRVMKNVSRWDKGTGLVVVVVVLFVGV